MTIQIISSNVNVTGSGVDAVSMAADGDIVIVQAGVAVASQDGGGSGIDGSNLSFSSVLIDGTAVAGVQFGVYVGSAQDRDNTVTISQTGQVYGQSGGVVLAGDGSRLSNAGTITSANTGVRLTEANGVNTGTIMGFNGIALNNDSDFSNLGTISGSNTGVRFSGNNSTLFNSGLIEAVGDLGASPGTSAGVYIYSSEGSVTTVRNEGTITGPETAIRSYSYTGPYEYGAPGVERIYNAGSILGNVYLGGNDDLFDGRGGTVTGAVHGGEGNDLYIVDDSDIVLVEGAGEGNDEVRAAVDYALAENFELLTLIGSEDIDGSGNQFQNVITGNAGDNVLFGNNSRDTIDGGAGADTIDGGLGGDVLYGAAGDDWMAGRASNDYLGGGGGDDFLFGGIGDDSMFGDEGNDTLKGGGGSDTMDGGLGQDTFVFTRVSDSVSPTSDIIENFVVDEDVLDFTGLVSGTLDVNILGGLTGGGQASLRTFENSFGDTVVFVDADGDGTADMRIEVNMVTGLTESDFLV